MHFFYFTNNTSLAFVVVNLHLGALYEHSMSAGVVNEDFFNDLQEEIACELRLMEAEEAEAERVGHRIKEFYLRLHFYAIAYGQYGPPGEYLVTDQWVWSKAFERASASLTPVSHP